MSQFAQKNGTALRAYDAIIRRSKSASRGILFFRNTDCQIDRFKARHVAVAVFAEKTSVGEYNMRPDVRGEHIVDTG